MFPHLQNLILNTDSYKASHWLQYPPGTDATFFYVESRGGLYDRTVFFGLQAILKAWLARPVTHADVDEARDFFAAHGEPFNEPGWRRIVDVHGGRMPMRIRAVPEGSVVHDRIDRSRGVLAAQLPRNAAAAPLVSGHRGHLELAGEAHHRRVP